MLDTRNEVVAPAPNAERVPTVEQPHRRLIDEITGIEALGIALYWLVSTTMLAAISPVPDGSQTALVLTLNIAFNVGFIGAIGGAATRRRLAYAGSIVAGGAMAVMATFCGLEGHTGLWIPAQFAVGAAAVGYSVRRLRN